MRPTATAALLMLLAAAPARASNSATFEMADQDGDGRITEGEFLGVFPFLALEPMRMADADRDGTLSRTEFVRAELPARVGRAPAGGLAPAVVAGQTLPVPVPFAVAADRARIGRQAGRALPLPGSTR